jgi:hypothetical protein
VPSLKSGKWKYCTYIKQTGSEVDWSSYWKKRSRNKFFR